jgi:hypothetical protein
MIKRLSHSFPLRLTNLLFEIERAAAALPEGTSLRRHIERTRDLVEDEMGLRYEDPIGQPYSETRTDVDASVAGSTAHDLVITETLKPIIRQINAGHSMILQKGIVVASARDLQR